jgi:hypothetical protein
METTNNVNAIVTVEVETEESKRAGLVRSEALNSRIKTLAETMNVSVTRLRELAFLNFEARNMKPSPKIADHIEAFDNAYPVGIRGEWESKLAELDNAVSEANKSGNATLIQFAMAMRTKEIKRHESQLKNVETAKKNKLARKASAVTSTSFDDYGMPIAI